MSGTMTCAQAWIERLSALGLAVRSRLRRDQAAGRDLSGVVGRHAADTIFAADQGVEAVVLETVAGWPDECRPLVLIAEGLGENGVTAFGANNTRPGFRLLVDPIDGTRGWMFDKRPAWFLAGIAQDRGEDTTSDDVLAAVMVELPTSKQGAADTWTATTEGTATGIRHCLQTGQRMSLQPRPSTSDTLRHGFGQVASFFPGTKMLAADLMERIVQGTLGPAGLGHASVFEDQYISTGGQLVELLVGHDRFCCDLRPLFARILRQQRRETAPGLECHPYDMAGLLVAQRGGVIVTDGFGRPLRLPLDVTTGVHWCGYANAALRSQIEPLIQGWLAEHGLTPND